MPVLGRSIPKALKSALSPAAKPIPREARRGRRRPAPITVASSDIPRRIWPRVAPSVRSMPSSRMRCATVIENVLKIRKLPTSSATKPNTSRITRRKESWSLMSCDWRAAACCPVSTTRRGGSTWAMRRLSSCGETPSAALTEMPSSCPTLSVRRCASGSVSWAVLEPPEEVSPSRWKPTIR